MTVARRVTLLLAVAMCSVVWLATRPGCSASPANTGADSISAGGVALLDPAKVESATLLSGPRYTVPYVWTNESSVVDLNSFLLPAAPREHINWTAGGGAVPEGRLRLGREPSRNKVRVFRIAAARHGNVEAAFMLVVIPLSTVRDFDAWLERQRKDMEWIQTLPPVYSRLGSGATNPEPDGCRPKTWPVLRKINVNYHPGAAYEMRSAIRKDGSGHQATYDASGELLRSGVAAGSADRAGPSLFNIFRLISHRNLDVLPYLWAAQLDGNPVNAKRFFLDFDRPLVREGDHIRSYLSVRPTFGPSRIELPPGVCIDGRAP